MQSTWHGWNASRRGLVCLATRREMGGTATDPKHFIIHIRIDRMFANPPASNALVLYNPQHTIPTLIEDGHVIWESYAIAIYLVEKYAKDDSLYPKDPKVRSIVNQRLFFDNGVMFKAAITYVEYILKKKLEPTDEMVQKLKKALELLESFVKERSFAAADHLTIADICLLSSVTMLAGIKYELEPYPAIQAWVARVTGELPNYAEFHKELLEKSLEYIKTL